jgi:dipeptidyl aminopeptidase/acylaminoacyl peptidase
MQRTSPRAALVLSLAAPLAGTAARAVPLEVYGRLPRIENVALSPDGTRIAFVNTEGNSRLIAIVALAGRSMIGGLRLGEQKLRRIEWADDERLIAVSSVTAEPAGFGGARNEWYQLQVYDLKSRRSELYPRGASYRELRVLNAIRDGRAVVRRLNGHAMLFMRGVELQGQTELPVLLRDDLENGAERLLARGTPATRQWIIDDDGEIAAREDLDESRQRWSLAIRRGGQLQETLTGTEGFGYPRVLGWGPAADSLLLQVEADGAPVWRLLSLSSGALSEPPPEYGAFDELLEDRFSNRLIGGVRVLDWATYHFFTPQLQTGWQHVLATFPGERVHYVSASASFRRLVVRVEGQSDGYQYALVDLDARRVQSLGDIYQGVSRPLETRRITYAAADGLQIPAYLTLPHDRPPVQLPLVVLPHGGPLARDTADFDWWSQALADQGYAVLRPNYRGSNVDWEFVSAGFGQWGRKMQSDLSDGVRYLAQQGLVDPARVCIVGASYGGYAALAGATLDPGVYRCAASFAGIADLGTFLAWLHERGPGRASDALRFVDRYLGVNSAADAALAALSPLNHVSAVTIPILLIHGRDDTVVPFEQSQAMYDALRREHKNAQLLALGGEDHWLSRSSTRLQMLKSVVAFLREYNPR